jgi:hypothetical protein
MRIMGCVVFWSMGSIEDQVHIISRHFSRSIEYITVGTYRFKYEICARMTIHTAIHGLLPKKSSARILW